MRTRTIAILIIIFALSQISLGQKNPDQTKFSIRVTLVSLDVEVLDQSGNQVQGLTRSDFIVEENGRPVEITNFSLSRGGPLNLMVVLDTSALSANQLSVCKQFLVILAHKLDHSDQLCLYSFDSKKVYLERDWTTQRPLLTDALENIGVSGKRSSSAIAELFGEMPPTGLAIDRGLNKLKDAGKGKKALLLISNRFRGLGPVTVEHVQLSGCTLLTLAFSHKTSVLITLGGDAISAHQLMRESGGRRFNAESRDLEQLGGQVASALKNYYSIGYMTEIKNSDNKPRKIRVRVPGRKCTVYYRRTYIPS